MGKIDDAYGLSVQDLNFDGYDDDLIAVEKNGECVSYECYLRVPRTDKFELDEILSAMCNVRADAELKAIFAFDQSVDYRDEGYYITCDKTTKYLWEGNKLVPDMYSAIYHSSENIQKPYWWALAYYDGELGDFLDSDDQWLTEEEYKARDWSFIYYFK